MEKKVKLEGTVLFNLGLNLQDAELKPIRKINKATIQLNLEKLKQRFGFNKKVPQEVLYNFYTAIRYYPELRKVNIKVRY